MSGGADAPRGYVYAATGGAAIALARHAARTLRAVAPRVSIDLWSDADCDDEVFDRVHRLDRSTIRPKFEALRRSRFARTIYLDNDTIVLADPSDAFDVLERFDIAGAHTLRRNTRFSRSAWRRDLPLAFPQINTGMLAVRKSEVTERFLAAVDAAIAETGAKKDQPIVRELLFDSDLRLAVLPPEYNYKNVRQAMSLDSKDTAPRILHVPDLHRRQDRTTGRVPPLADLFPPELLEHIDRLVASDRYIHPETASQARALSVSAPGRRIAARLRRLLHRPPRRDAGSRRP